MIKILTIILLSPMLAFAQHGFTGLLKSTLHDLFIPTSGTLIVTDTQTVNGWGRSWSQEPSIFYDNVTGETRIYFTGGKDSLGQAAYVNRIGYTSTTNFTTFTSPLISFGVGAGSGVPSTRRATSSWTGKVGAKYYSFALNGYPGLVHAGQDANIYGYSSNDGIAWQDEGMKFNKATAWLGGPLPNTGMGASGFGNTGICTDQYNNPVVIAGKYVAIVDIFDGSIWRAVRAEADSLMGNWTLTHSLSSMQVATNGLYGGSQLLFVNGVYYVFYHYAPTSGNLPSYLGYATSTDCINWTKKETPIFTNILNPYGTANSNQIADPFLCEINGKVFMVAEYTDGNPPYPARVMMWTYNGTFDQMIIQTK